MAPYTWHIFFIHERNFPIYISSVRGFVKFLIFQFEFRFLSTKKSESFSNSSSQTTTNPKKNYWNEQSYERVHGAAEW